MKTYREGELSALAKRCRLNSGKSRAEVASELCVSNVSIFNAEENPEQSLTKIRVRMIETYGSFHVVGPLYLLKKK